MSRVRGKDTGPEMAVRRLLHRAGFRYRLHRRDLPGRPDVVLPRHRAAVFVHGCFWHGHGCSLFRLPATRTEFWTAKIDANRRRDEAAVAALAGAGWRSLWVWECALRGRGRLAPEALSARMVAFVEGDRGFDAIQEDLPDPTSSGSERDRRMTEAETPPRDAGGRAPARPGSTGVDDGTHA